MSISIMNAAWDMQLPQAQKLLLIALADQSNDDGESWPRMSSLERRTGMSRRTLQRSLLSLEKSGLIRREYRSQRSTLYVLSLVGASGAGVGVTMTGVGVTMTGVGVTMTGVGVTMTGGGRHHDAPLYIEGTTNRTTNESVGRGTRLQDDWKPSEKDIEFCLSERPDLDPHQTARRFADYWRGVPGAKGRKLDWSATWRNWVRNERKGNAPAQIDMNRFVESLEG